MMLLPRYCEPTRTRDKIILSELYSIVKSKFFSQIPADALSALLADKEALSKVLLRHGVGGSVLFSKVQKIRKIFPKKYTKIKKGIMWGETETAGGDKVATQVFRRGVIKVRRQLSINLEIMTTLSPSGCVCERGWHQDSRQSSGR